MKAAEVSHVLIEHALTQTTGLNFRYCQDAKDNRFYRVSFDTIPQRLIELGEAALKGWNGTPNPDGSKRTAFGEASRIITEMLTTMPPLEGVASRLKLIEQGNRQIAHLDLLADGVVEDMSSGKPIDKREVMSCFTKVDSQPLYKPAFSGIGLQEEMAKEKRNVHPLSVQVEWALEQLFGFSGHFRQQKISYPDSTWETGWEIPIPEFVLRQLGKHQQMDCHQLVQACTRATPLERYDVTVHSLDKGTPCLFVRTGGTKPLANPKKPFCSDAHLVALADSLPKGYEPPLLKLADQCVQALCELSMEAIKEPISILP